MSAGGSRLVPVPVLLLLKGDNGGNNRVRGVFGIDIEIGIGNETGTGDGAGDGASDGTGTRLSNWADGDSEV